MQSICMINPPFLGGNFHITTVTIKYQLFLH